MRSLRAPASFDSRAKAREASFNIRRKHLFDSRTEAGGSGRRSLWRATTPRNRNEAGRRPGTRRAHSSTPNDPSRPKPTVLEMFPYPSGRIHMGHVAQLHDGRRARAFPPRARVQRAASDGMGRVRLAGRERGAREGHESRANGPTPILRRCANSCKAMGLAIDWSREFATCDPAYYQPAAEAVPGFLEGRSRLSLRSRCELGSGRRHRARQRAGDRGTRLALRRARRAAQARAMVLQDHRL